MGARTPSTLITRLLAAATAFLFALPGGTEVRHLTLATFSVGDKRDDLAAGSEAFLTHYRFQAGGHSYALSSSLRGAVARDLVFVDDRLACVMDKRRYRQDSEGEFWRHHTGRTYPVCDWEWANEPDGLGYLSALLREACGLEQIGSRRALERRWGSRTMTGDEIAEAAAEIASQIPFMVAYGFLTQGYGGPWPPGSDPDARRDFERRDRLEVEQRIWSLPLGLPAEEVPAVLGVPDVQFTWRRTGTTVIAYQLGSLNPYFVGVVDGRVAWIRGEYPGLVLQAKLAAIEQAEARRPPPADRGTPARD